MQPADDILISRSKNGDLEAFELLVKRYENKVYTVAYRFLGNHADASDLAQEAFLRLYQSLSGFRGESGFMTWMYRITANVCRDELRRRQKYQVISLDAEDVNNQNNTMSQLPGRDPTPEEALENKEFNELIQQCLLSLSEEHRLVLIMREIQDMSYEEIADVLKCSLGTVKSRLNRARMAFREKYNARREPYGQNARLAK